MRNLTGWIRMVYSNQDSQIFYAPEQLYVEMLLQTTLASTDVSP